jgi:peptide-methionine (R)-S-oxide reductase
MPEKTQKTDAQWRAELTPAKYHVLREKGTERAFTGEFAETKHPGTYTCAGCGTQLFRSDEKFESGSGWPSFWAPADPNNV